ncbi:hypothetical protein IQ03_05285 [Gemmobacter caeni]|uniref:Helix-turn-helix protein n=1 Tax=Gemmobacter caeni TaxID=589035 RepID=A0A2T6A061_9RHOB|nr:hypothetical protein [Gemmobacter caeni]PTX37183.1 hypothetical protein C8N34_1523 [Gemmobacter caeni]TWI87740.1 hypothetical protein IQ03_05285 [Gemmobacter caeni]
MAMIRHPITGVEINEISITRPRNLTEDEARTARILRAEGHKVQDIAAMLGTNQGRVHAALGSAPAAGDDQASLI